MNIDPKILERLDALAAKVGATGEHLWRILLVQARVELVNSIVWMAGSALVAWFLFGQFKKNVTAAKDASWKDEERYVFYCILFGTGCAIAVIVFLAALASIPSEINPEYWALKQILGGGK